MNKNQAKLKENRILKITGLFIMAFLLLGTVFTWHASKQMAAFEESSDLQAADSTSYYQTESCYNLMQEEAQEISDTAYEIYYSGLSSVTEMNERLNALKTQFGADRSNSQFRLERKQNTADSYTVVKDNIDLKNDYGVQHTWTLVSGSDGELHLFDSDNHEPGLFNITIAVRDPIVYKDRYYNSYTVFNRFFSHAAWLFPAASVIMFILFVLIGIYECIACGHTKNVEGIHELWLDKIPYELLTAVSLFLSYFWFSVNYEGINEPVTFLLALVPAFLLLFIWFLSTLVRIKASHFKKYTLTNILMERVKTVPAAWDARLLILAFLFLVITSVLGITSMNPVLTVCLIIVDIALILLAFAVVWSVHILLHASKELAAGNLDFRISQPELSRLCGPFLKQAENLNSISDGMKIAISERMKSERLKTELITNVSHDLRTPLTSIISYTDLLQKDHSEKEGKEYLDGLARQSKRLNRLCTDLVDASKASTGNVPVRLEKVNMKELIEQSVAEYEVRFIRRKLEIVTETEPEDLAAYADGRLLWRVLSNLFSNVSKYTLERTRVYVNTCRKDNHVVTISIKNISKEKLNISAEELMERFIRGDRSRHSEGSGLGLDIARSLVELMKGEFRIVIDGDLFTAFIDLPEFTEETI